MVRLTSIKKNLRLLLIFFCFVLGGTTYVYQSKNQKTSQYNCIIKKEERVVRGDSMEGIVDSGKRVTFLTGYYDCHEVMRNDLVAYKFGNQKILLKQVRAVPGDSFAIDDLPNGSAHIVVNNQVLRNFEGVEYVLDERKKRVLAGYATSYNGTVPEGAYLIFGNISTGSVDSTRFGLVGRPNILAKVIVHKP